MLHRRSALKSSSSSSAFTINAEEKQYLDLLQDVLGNGTTRDDRTGTGTRSVFARQLRFSVSDQFPLLTTKKLHLKSIIYELLWFLRGERNVRWLQEHGVTIWNEWANDQTGDLGPIYGHQWRHWPGPAGEIDQIAGVVKSLKTNPNSRRHIVTAWNPGDIPQMALPPCHMLFQFYVADRKLSCQMYQRSADLFLGLPFNIASYALLTLMMAQVVGLHAHEVIITIGDAHLYSNHFPQAQEQLGRSPKPFPRMRLNPEIKDIFSFAYEDFTLEGYEPHPAIKAPIAV